MKLLARLFGRGVRANVEDCIHIAGVNIAVRLTKKYAHKYDRYDIDKVSALASAVTNELFGAPPGNEMGRQFLAANKELVESNLRELKDEPEICYIASLLCHTRANVAGNMGTVTPDMVLHAVKLRELGVLLPIEKVRLASSPEDLMRQTREFELWALSG